MNEIYIQCFKFAFFIEQSTKTSCPMLGYVEIELNCSVYFTFHENAGLIWW